MKKMTVGFVYSEDSSKVLLVLKNRPDWQAGKYNGPGGKVEKNESSAQCVAREIKEETALDIKEASWRKIAELTEVSKGAHVEFFAAIYDGELKDAQKTTDEEIGWHVVSKLPTNIIPNLNWLIPLGIEALEDDTLQPIKITYS